MSRLSTNVATVRVRFVLSAFQTRMKTMKAFASFASRKDWTK